MVVLVESTHFPHRRLNSLTFLFFSFIFLFFFIFFLLSTVPLVLRGRRWLPQRRTHVGVAEVAALPQQRLIASVANAYAKQSPKFSRAGWSLPRPKSRYAVRARCAWASVTGTTSTPMALQQLVEAAAEHRVP